MFDFELDFKNTKQMSLAPQSPEEFNQLDHDTGKTIELLPVMSGEAFAQLVAYPVIVEGWEKKNYGRHKRAWMAEFTQAERNKISRYYGRFYRWYLVTGSPKRVSCRLNTLELLQRAVNFFAGVN